MNIALGCDHAGFPLKATIVQALREKGHKISDFGTYSTDPVDFPDIARKVGASVVANESDRGIMICGTGAGAVIASNKIPGIRAALCHDSYTAHQCVEHDNVNVMCVGAQIIGDKAAVELIDIFLKAEFSTSEEFRIRVEKLDQMDKQREN